MLPAVLGARVGWHTVVRRQLEGCSEPPNAILLYGETSLVVWGTLVDCHSSWLERSMLLQVCSMLEVDW